MSAELLRRAAALMRERAEAAPSGEGWYVDAGDVWVMHDPDGNSASRLVESFPIWADGADKHIASWHPAVALAVAQLLAAAARVLDAGNYTVESDAIPTWLHCEIDNLANAYLGESA